MKISKYSEITPKNLHCSNVYAYLGLAEGIVMRVTTMAPGAVREEPGIPADHVQLVLKGSVTLMEKDGTLHQLEALDAIGFEAREYRRMENTGADEALLLIVDHGSPHDAWGPEGPGAPHP